METDSFRIRDMTSKDVEGLARLHQKTFDGALGASVGRVYLRAFFRWFVGNPESINLVCTKGSVAIGYVFGAPDGYGIGMNRTILWPTVFSVLSHPWVVGHPSFRTQIMSRLRNLMRRSSGERLGTGDSLSPEPTDTNSMYVLVGIGVSPESRRQGLANCLIDAFENRVWERGYQALRLTVFASNTHAISLYESRGWKRALHEGVGQTLKLELLERSKSR